jgi:DNA primase
MPIATALFDLLREAAPTITPEQRAAFRARLVAACARIGDRGLAQEYRRDLLDRYFAAFRRGGPAGRTSARPRADRPTATIESTGAERIRTLTAIILRHPALAPKLEDPMAQLVLPSRVRGLIDAVLAYTDAAENLDFNSLIAHLHSLDLADDVAWALGDVPCPSPAYAGASATASEAEAGWWHIYGLMRGNSLVSEVAAAWKRWHDDPTDANQQRWIALCSALNRWRCGGDESLADEAGPGAVRHDQLGRDESGVA